MLLLGKSRAGYTDCFSFFHLFNRLLRWLFSPPAPRPSSGLLIAIGAIFVMSQSQIKAMSLNESLLRRRRSSWNARFVLRPEFVLSGVLRRTAANPCGATVRPAARGFRSFPLEALFFASTFRRAPRFQFPDARPN